jgi:hypothetical protein
MKRRDTAQKLKGTLKRDGEPVDLAACLQATLIWLSDAPSSVRQERPLTGPGGGSIKSATGANKGKVEYAWRQDDLIPGTTPQSHKLEVEVEWPEVGGVKQLETFPNGKEPAPQFKTLEVLQDLGGVGGP